MKLLIFILALSTCNKIDPVKLDGSGSYSKTGIIKYKWFQVSAPTPVIFDNPDSAIVFISADKPKLGVYIIGLEITDSLGDKNIGTATITVTK